MRFITHDQGTIELNYMWLPTFLGQNTELKKELEATLRPEVVGLAVTEQLLDHIHRRVIDIICKKYPLPGLRDYLDGIKFIDEGSLG